MRDLIVPRLRARWPSARIIHEFPVRYSSNRIDLAAVTETEIISVEIKSSKDVADRLEAQLRAFLPISTRMIVALAPKWNEKLSPEVRHPSPGVTSYLSRYTEAQDTIRKVASRYIETWTVDADAGSVEITDKCYRDNRPWHDRLLDILHVEELRAIAARHRIAVGKRPNHLDLCIACGDMMTGREIVAAVCGAVRARAAFAAGTDAPIHFVPVASVSPQETSQRK